MGAQLYRYHVFIPSMLLTNISPQIELPELFNLYVIQVKMCCIVYNSWRVKCKGGLPNWFNSQSLVEVSEVHEAKRFINLLNQQVDLTSKTSNFPIKLFQRFTHFHCLYHPQVCYLCVCSITTSAVFIKTFLS